jgi:hypothetical protein
MVIAQPVGVGNVAVATGLGTTQKIFQSSLTAGGNYTLNLPGSNKLNGKKFGVRMSGNAFGHTAATTLQLQLLGLAPGGANVILAQSTARTLQTAAFNPWTLEAELIVDGTQVLLASGNFSGSEIGSGILTGQFKDTIFGTAPAIDAPAILTNNISANINMANEPSLQFFAAVLFATSDALNVATLLEFFAYAND